MSLEPHEFWQTLDAPGTHCAEPDTIYHSAYPATLPDGRQLVLPIRALPDGEGAAVASLIVNQAAFAVEDALADIMAEQWRQMSPDVVIGVPTLGLPLANALARRLGHPRMVPLGTSRKFWYTDALSEPLSSITSPGKGKVMYLDPRMVPLLVGRKVLLVDDVVSTGTSIAAVLRLLAKAGIEPAGISVAMEQGDRWRDTIAKADLVRGAIRSPLLQTTDSGYVVATRT
ncbi:phosphoribosyltransferase [Rhodobacteraceae bacterium N5(2021)]|uniref:Phosphoribosyltransferase n=1 Tax=Gymnodinialimonas phycosphaerae TaxID=2841589 RepID=A0A975TRC5_9RHOB|nr:phosphoribosyltransferase [Gymnodinialimonas phycosphaerae]MBY4893598.1 phosphoribosyltransferase [Gymnodinialimonas phycosphaerae]